MKVVLKSRADGAGVAIFAEEEAPFVVRVVALHLFNNFGELYATLPLLKCGYTEETIDTA